MMLPRIFRFCRRPAFVVAFAFCLWGCCDALLAEEPKAKAPEAAVLLPSAPVMASGKHAENVSKRLGKLDPGQDDWDTEVFQNQIGQQLQELGTMLASRKAISATALAEIADPGVEVGPLRPADLVVVFRGRGGEVLRASPLSKKPINQRGFEGLQLRLQELAAGFQATPPPSFKFKIFRVDADGETIKTTAYYLAYAVGQPTVQQNAIWNAEWTKPPQGESPQLLRLQASDFEEVVGPANQTTMFSDKTDLVLGQDEVYRRQLVPGIHDWQSRLQSTVGVDVYGHQGLAVGDVNGDGLDDLFVSQHGGLPNRLFIHNPDGTASDRSKQYGVDMLDQTIGALFVDFDNDGDQDLAVLTPRELLIFANDRQQRFKSPFVAVQDAGHAFSLSAADYDLDGNTDLFMCGYSYPDGATHVPMPYHDANNGFRNRLLHNEGKMRFKEVTSETGLDKNNRRYSFASSWEDYDNDGDLDLYVANDYGRNNLFRNDVPAGGGFVDVAAEAGVEDISAGMSVTWADYNNDGWMDLYVSNMFSSAGSRVTYQRQFRHGDKHDLANLYQRHARGNSLFENAGDGTFRDVSLEKRVTMGRWAWGSQFVDIDNDGREDIVVANGNITGKEKDDL